MDNHKTEQNDIFMTSLFKLNSICEGNLGSNFWYKEFIRPFDNKSYFNPNRRGLQLFYRYARFIYARSFDRILIRIRYIAEA